MACRIFATLETAMSKVLEYCLSKEQDVFIVKTCFPSGEEFSFRTHTEMTFFKDTNVIHHENFPHPMLHKFMTKENAYLQGKKLANKNKKIYYIETYRNAVGRELYFKISPKVTSLCEFGNNDEIKPLNSEICLT